MSSLLPLMSFVLLLERLLRQLPKMFVIGNLSHSRPLIFLFQVATLDHGYNLRSIAKEGCWAANKEVRRQGHQKAQSN